ncbi:MAG: hypothetical protein J1E43_05080 [Christensenellaceae bacterium]|nr:hypothetical protein [Christensenellaceae bacterium]
MKVIAIAAVTAGGKTTVVHELKRRLPRAAALHFDDYSFDGEVEDYYQWVLDGANYNVWDLTPLEKDIQSIRNNGLYEYLLLDYPFAYQHSLIKDDIDCAIFIDTPLDIAMARRVLRDDRDATAEKICNDMEMYLQYSRAAYVQMLKDILPSSDYVIDGTKSLDAIVDEIISIITED